MQILLFFLLVFYYFYLIFKEHILNYIFGIYCVFYLVALYSGIINNDIYDVMVFFAKTALPALGLMIFTEIGITYYTEQFIQVGARTLSFLCILNAIFILFLPKGFYIEGIYERVNFLATDNVMTCYYFAAFCFVGIRRILYRKRYSVMDIVFFVSFFFAEFFVFCGIGMLCCVVLVCLQYCLIRNKKRLDIRGIKDKFHFWLFYIIILIGQLWITMGNFWTPIIMNVAELFFEKGESFRVRRIIWQGAIEQIMRSPLFGMGPTAIASQYNRIRWYSHNGFLDVLLKTGCLGMAFCILSHCFAIAKLEKADNHVLAAFVYACLFTVFVISFLEGPFFQGKYIFIFAIAYRIPNIVNGSEWRKYENA